MKSISIRILLVGLIISLILIFQINQSFGTIIPSERLIAWNPGIPSGIPDYPVGANVKDYGADGNGSADDTKAFRNAIAATPSGHALLIPKGTYKITSNLEITKGIVLRGEGYKNTKLKCEGTGSCIEIERWGEGSWVKMTAGYTQGSKIITVEDGSDFSTGDYVATLQDNDPNVYKEGTSGSWSNTNVGQILKITNVSGNKLTLNEGLYYTYNGSYNPRIKRKNMVEYAGIEDLYIERVNSSGSGSAISMTHAAYCWVRRVYSYKTMSSHVFMSRSYRCEIRDSYFNDSHVHGEGGQGYGIRCENRSTDNLIENNIFNHLRHSMVLSWGATGNVFGYNYSRDPYGGPINWLFPDGSVHGHHAYMNLYEGNTLQFMLADNVWGTNGPTTFFRNRIEKDISHYLSGCDNVAYIEVQKNNPYINIIGNELGIANSFSTNPIKVDSAVSSTVIVHGNYDYQAQTTEWDPDISDHNLPNSFYRNSKPSWFGSLPWPLIGGDISSNNIIPAKQRYIDGSLIPDSYPSVNRLTPPKNLRIVGS